MLLLALAAFMAPVHVFAMGRSMTQDEIRVREAKAKADIEADEARKKVDIEADEARKKVDIEADEAMKKNKALEEQKEAEAKI